MSKALLNSFLHLFTLNITSSSWSVTALFLGFFCCWQYTIKNQSLLISKFCLDNGKYVSVGQDLMIEFFAAGCEEYGVMNFTMTLILHAK